MVNLRKKSFQMAFCLTFLIALFCLCQTKVAAQEKTVKVGYMDYNGFIQEYDDGTFYGYGVDYLEEISKYTGWKYEYVYGSWPVIMEKLQKGEIDLLCTAQKLDSRLESFDFSIFPVGYTQGLLYARKENNNIFYDDFKAIDGKKIGVLQGSAMGEIFASYAKLNNFTYIQKDYPNDILLNKALQSGEIDLMATEILAGYRDLKLVTKYGTDAYYFMTAKNNPLMEQINFAQREIKTNVNFENELYNKHYGNKMSESVTTYTREEIDYIKSAPVLKVGNLPNHYPLSSLNAKTGKLEGITEDVLDLISEKSGLKFEFGQLEINQKPMSALKSGQFDLVAGIVWTKQFAQDSTLSVSTPFLHSNWSMVAKPNFDYSKTPNLKVAVMKSFQALQTVLENEYPNFKISLYETSEDCLRAVQSGEADVVIQNVFVLTYLLQNPRYENLQILPTSFYEEKSGIASLSTADPRLMSVINKTIASLPAADMQEIITAHTISSPYTTTIGDVFYKYRILMGLIFLILVIIVSAVVNTIIIRKKNMLELQEKNRQLAQAVHEADTANKVKSVFLARVSHEIRTPMNAIIGITSIAKNHVDSPLAINEYLEKISASSKILLNIINDVLDMSAIENEKMNIALLPFDFKQLILSLTNLYYVQCKNKGIKFQVEISQVRHESLVGDSLRLNQILMNLLSNAFKFTEPGGSIILKVTQTGEKESQVYLRFIVEDTGVGISEEMLGRLFDPFEQESQETALKHGGSGLGLSITKNLTELMHGQIKADSVKGKGTTFIVDLPFGIVKEPLPQALSIEKIKALVVDDDENERKYAGSVLQRIGLDYRTAATGQEAVELLQKAQQDGECYKVCFVDWCMPDLNGLEVTKKIRETFDEKTIIIIVSAYDLSEIEQEARQAGANLFITKPLFQSTVFDVLMNLTDKGYKKITADEKVYDFTGKRVLLVEDNALNMEIATELLTMVGLKVDQAENGQKAVEKFCSSEEYTYDAILMDIQMPVLDGHEAAKAIRNLLRSDGQSVPIYAMTANAFNEDVTAALSAGMNGHISKPIDTKILYDTLTEAFEIKDKIN